jgi:hypothetical protein
MGGIGEIRGESAGMKPFCIRRDFLLKTKTKPF